MEQTKEVFTDYSRYVDVREYGTDEDPRPWNFLEVVEKYIPSEGRILDAGCGTAFKLIELQRRGARADFVGFDNSWNQLVQAQKETKEAYDPGVNIDIIQLVQADILPRQGAFPFQGETFNAVTFMLSKHNAQEAHRILKPSGIVIMERVGEAEKRQAKEYFGYDSDGKPRGYLMDSSGPLLLQYRQDFEGEGFQILEVRDGIWKTRYTPEGLRVVLKETPFVKNYDEETDAPIVEQIITDFSIKKGPHQGKIPLNQHRILIVAKKSPL